MTPLEEAIKARDEFLKDNPKLQAYQDEIDDILDKSGAGPNRTAVLGTLMQGKLLEMQQELLKLSTILSQSLK